MRYEFIDTRTGKIVSIDRVRPEDRRYVRGRAEYQGYTIEAQLCPQCGDVIPWHKLCSGEPCGCSPV